MWKYTNGRALNMTRDGIKAIRPLIEQLPDFYQNSPEVVDLQNAFTKQINSAWIQREEFLNQLNVCNSLY